MSSWALSLQWCDIVRVWTRREAKLVRRVEHLGNLNGENLPIPDRPVRDLAQAMYKPPRKKLTVWVEEHKEQLLYP
jgi:hypothetical protein